MPITADATALVALGSIGRINLLAGLNTEFFISSWVRHRELRQFAVQIDSAVGAHWLREVTPSRTIVDQLRRQAELDLGEAESIVVASELNRSGMQLLLDEGRAFQWVQQHQRRPPRFHLVCLGQVLHQLEALDAIESAAILMQDLLESDAYSWAPVVRQFYEVWCQRHSIAPLPSDPRT